MALIFAANMKLISLAYLMTLLLVVSGQEVCTEFQELSTATIPDLVVGTLIPVGPTVRRIELSVLPPVGTTDPPKVQLITADPAALADATSTGDYYEIEIATNNAGSIGEGVSIAKRRGTMDIAPTDVLRSYSVSDPGDPPLIDLAPGLYVEFHISVTTNSNGEAAIEVGNKTSTEKYVTLFDPNPTDVIYVGVTGDGAWRVCESTETLLVNNLDYRSNAGSTTADLSDGDLGTCLTDDASGTPSGWRVYLDGEYEIYGVRIKHDGTELQNARVRVGNCGFIAANAVLSTIDETNLDLNVRCSGPISLDEEASTVDADFVVYQACPTNTYGNVVYLTVDSATGLTVCEIEIYGVKRPDNEKTSVSFDSAVHSITEGDSATETLTVRRTGHSADNPTCSIAIIQELGTVGLQIGNGNNMCAALSPTTYEDIDMTGSWPKTVIIAKDDDTVDVPITVCDDSTGESVETVFFEIDDTEDYVACAGTLSNTELIVTDNDPTYNFEYMEYNVEEDDGSVVINVIRSGLALNTPSTVGYNTAGGIFPAATDDPVAGMSGYMSEASGTLSFSLNDNTKTITIPLVNGDMTYNPERFFLVELMTEITVDTTEVGITDDDPGFQLSEATYTDVETTGYIEVTILNIGSTKAASSVTLTASDGTALQGSDFVAFSMLVEFEIGAEFKKINVPIIDDVLIEVVETFEVTLTAPEAAHVTGTNMQATLTIGDDDATVSMADNTLTVTERETEVTATINRESTEYIDRAAWVDVEIVSVTATAGADYYNPITNPVRVYFVEGEATTTISVRIIDDRDIEEADETFIIRLTDADSTIDGTADETIVTVQSDDAEIWIEQPATGDIANVVEGSAYNVMVMRRGGTAFTHEVYFNTNSADEDDATADADFNALSAMRIEFLPDQSDPEVVMVETIEDDLVEIAETFRVTISSPNEDIVDPDRNELVITILDNDSLIGFQKLSYEGTEPSGSDGDTTTVAVTLTRGGDISGFLQIEISTVVLDVENSASTADFTPIINRVVTFEPGRPDVIERVEIIEDNIPEFPESFGLIVRDISGGFDDIDPDRASTTITILDDDFGPFQLEMDAYDVAEGDVLVVNILRPGSSAGFADVLLTLSPITATYPEDYGQESVMVRFNPEQTEAPVQIGIAVDDDIDELDETFKITLSIESDFGTVDPAASEAIVTIRNSRSLFELSTNSPTVLESDSSGVTVTIRRTDSANVDGLVSLQTIDGTATNAGDYAGFSKKTFSFPSGRREMSFKIDIVDNNFIEDREETFSVGILFDDGTIDDSSILVITIIDDDGFFFFAPNPDAAPPGTDDIPDDKVYYTANEDDGSVSLTIERAGNNLAHSSVRVTTISDTAKENTDFEPLRNQVVDFAPSLSTATVTITIIADDTKESAETFYVEITDAVNGAAVIPYKARVTITDISPPRSPGSLSTNAIIGIVAGVGGIVIIIIIALIAFCVMGMPSTPKPLPTRPMLPNLRLPAMDPGVNYGGQGINFGPGVNNNFGPGVNGVNPYIQQPFNGVNPYLQQPQQLYPQFGRF